VRPTVHGLELDAQTRCAHWRSPLDIVAIRMWCCGAYYACRQCHDAMADHPAQLWDPEVGYGVIDPSRAVGALLSAGGASPPAPQRVSAPVLGPAPDRTDAIVAIWVAAVGATTVVVLLVGVPVIRRGRQRGWRAGPL